MAVRNSIQSLPSTLFKLPGSLKTLDVSPIKTLINETSFPEDKSSIINKKLSPEHLAPIGPDYTNSWQKRPLVLSEKTRLKYNIATCTAIDITESGTKLLTDIYHKVHGLPGFVHRFLQGKPSLARALFVLAPQIYPIFDTPYDNSKTLLMLNPDYLDSKEFLLNCQKVSPSYALQQLKNSKNGLALVTWYIHPEALPVKFHSNLAAQEVLKDYRKRLIREANIVCKDKKKRLFDYYRYGSEIAGLEHCGTFSKLPRTSSQLSISELEARSKSIYFASLFDLDKNPKQSLIYLKSLRRNILSTLETVYGVTPEDKIKIYLHMPYLDPTTTLHVHIRVNQADHALEDAKSFGLNEIIDTLEKKGTVTNLILSRGIIYCSEYPIGKNVDGVYVKTVPNLKRDWNDIFQILKAKNEVATYLLQALNCIEVKNRMQLLDIKEIEKLLKVLEADKQLPTIDQLVDILKTMEINKELGELGWSLETGNCNEEQTFGLSMS
ncbi:hypothetical protein ACNVED_09755 [Legionella sp. D16C41]|uniref:hypothetical protein n=1 Tax=Legionella sp. D16C41 TaxID=3402688 RepID=UPI003AF7121B